MKAVILLAILFASVSANSQTKLKDLLYGETINTVRHELMIPVLIVHL